MMKDACGQYSDSASNATTVDNLIPDLSQLSIEYKIIIIIIMQDNSEIEKT